MWTLCSYNILCALFTEGYREPTALDVPGFVNPASPHGPVQGGGPAVTVHRAQPGPQRVQTGQLPGHRRTSRYGVCYGSRTDVGLVSH